MASEALDLSSLTSFLKQSLPPIKKDPQSIFETEGSRVVLRSSTAESGSAAGQTEDIEQLRSEIVRLQFCVDSQQKGSKGARPHQKVVSGSQFRLPPRESTPCQNCEGMEKSVKKAKDTIRTMKLNTTRLEETNEALRRHRNEDDLTELLEAKANLLKKYEVLELELGKLRARCVESEKREKLAEISISSISHESHCLKDRNSELEKAIIDEKKSRESFESDLEEHKRLLANLTARLRSLELDSLDKDNEAIRRRDEEIRVLKIQIELISTDLQTLRQDLTIATSSLAENKLLMRSIETARNQLKISFDELFVSTKLEVDQLTSTLDASNTRLEQVEAEKKVLKEETDRVIGAKHAEIEILKKELEMLRSKNIEQLQQESSNKQNQQEEAEKTRKAIEKAISSSVRLCVVAPTVNVHLSDRKLKFNNKSGISEMGLREFIQDEVLSKYSFLFKQETENSSPDGINIQVWVQQMLDRMQLAIEAHVNAAMESSR